MTNPRFIPTQINSNGFCRLGFVDDVRMEDLLKKFPDGRRSGLADEENGYSEDELGFEDTQTKKQYSVYSRWGNVRIGGMDDPLSYTGAVELAKFLQEA